MSCHDGFRCIESVQPHLNGWRDCYVFGTNSVDVTAIQPALEEAGFEVSMRANSIEVLDYLAVEPPDLQISGIVFWAWAGAWNNAWDLRRTEPLPVIYTPLRTNGVEGLQQQGTQQLFGRNRGAPVLGVEPGEMVVQRGQGIIGETADQAKRVCAGDPGTCQRL
jgi:hypothetical protein